MEGQTQSPRVTSSEGGDAPSAGISVEPSAPLPSAPLPSCASTSEPVTPLPPPPVSSRPWAKAADTPDAASDHAPPSAVIRPLKEAALTDTEKELLGAAVVRAMSGPLRAGSVSGIGVPLGGAVAGSYGWMSQPGLLFGKEEDSPVPADTRKQHQMELGAGRDQTKAEVERSDPSSIDSSQEEDSLEKLTPDSPFEVLAEIQDKGPREEGRLQPPPAPAGVQESFFFTGGTDGWPSGESARGNGSEPGVAPLGARAQGEAGPKARDAKPNFPSGDRPKVQEDGVAGGSRREEERGRQSTKAEAVESSARRVVVKSVQSSPSGPVPGSSGPQDKGESNLEANLLQGSSDMKTEPVTIPTGEAQSLRQVHSKQPIMDKHEAILTHTPGAKTPTDRGNEAHAPSPEMPTRRSMDGLSPEEELKAPSSFLRQTPRLVEESVLGQGAPRAPAIPARAALDHVPPEALAVDSRESGNALVEGPLGHNPLAQRGKAEQKVMSSFGELQNLVLVPVMNVAEIARERGVRDGDDEAIGPTARSDKETRSHPEDVNSSKMEEKPGFAGASQEIQPGLARAPQEEFQPGLARAPQEIQPGLARAPQEIQPGLAWAPQEEEFQPGLARAPQEEEIQLGLARAPQEEFQPGLARAPQEEEIQPGLARAPQEEEIQPGLARAPQEIQPGLARASQEIQPGLTRVPQEEEIQPGLARAPQEEEFQPGLARAPQEEEFQPGLARAPQEEEFQPGLARASQEEEIQPGLARAPQEEFQPGLARAPQEEEFQPGLARAPQEEEFQPGLARASQEEEIQPGLARASQEEEFQPGLARASQEEEIQPGLARASQEIQPGLARASQEIQPGLTRVPQEIQPGLARAPQEIQPGLTRVPQEEQQGLARAPQEIQPGLARAPQEIQPGLARAPQEIQPGLARAPQEEQQGLARAPQEEQQGLARAPQEVEQPGGPLEALTGTQAMRWSHGDVEPPAPEVPPPLPVTDQLPSKYQRSAVDGACRHLTKPSPESSPVPLWPDLPAPDKAVPPLSITPDLGPREEARELTVELRDTSAPLQEMIRRSAIQRGQLSREKQVLPTPPAPGADPAQSVVVRSTPVLAETPSTTVKPEPLKLAEDEASDLLVENAAGQFPPTQPSQETRLTAVPVSGGGPMPGRGQEADPTAEEGGGVSPGETSPPSPQDRAVSGSQAPALPPAHPADSGQREREPPEAVVGGEDAERLSRTTVKDLVYWSDPKKTGAVFGSTLTLLVSLAVFSVVSVLAYLVLALLSVTISFRIYKSVIQAVQKTNDGNPFRVYLEQDITLSADTFRKYCDTALAHVNCALKYLLQLFLVQDLVDSLKLAVLMWLMTYVGAVFNGLTLLILAVLLTFSVPAIYKKYQTEIDHYVDLVQKQVSCMVGKIQEKLPGTKRKNE